MRSLDSMDGVGNNRPNPPEADEGDSKGESDDKKVYRRDREWRGH